MSFYSPIVRSNPKPDFSTQSRAENGAEPSHFCFFLKNFKIAFCVLNFVALRI